MEKKDLKAYERNCSMYIPEDENIFTLTEKDIGRELCGWNLAAVPGFVENLDNNASVLQEILNMHALAMTHMDAIALDMAETKEMSVKAQKQLIDSATIRAT